MKNFNTLSEREILALAISLEEEDERVYADFAEGLMQDFPAMQIGAGRSSFSRSIDEPGDYPQRKLLAVPTSRAANQYPSPEDQGASQRHLRCGRYDRCLHKTMSNPGNDSEFNQDDKKSYRHCRAESRDQERQRMADPTESCHGAAGQSADPRVATPCEAAVVRQCLGETHADSCTQRRGQSDKKRIPGVPSCKSCREHWGQRRHRTIHESGKTRLYDLQNKESSPGLIFIFVDLWAQLFLDQLLRPVLVRGLFLSQVIEQLADTGILSLAGNASGKRGG
jgi:hypothetical protein